MTPDPRIAPLLEDTFLPAYLHLLGDERSRLTVAAGWALLSSGGAPGLRQHEAFVYGAAPALVLDQLIALAPPLWVSGFGWTTDQTSALRGQGFGAPTHEFLMQVPVTAQAFATPPAFPVKQVRTEAEALEVNQALGRDFAPVGHLQDPTRIYIWLQVEGRPAVYGRAVIWGEDVVLDNVVTRPEFRRRGLGRAVVQALIGAAASQGVRRCVLLSSEMGRPLYAALGFETVAGLEVLAWEGAT
ncbi:GNAT family N-acetyltransferase [Deinococcus sp. HMF7604]|uniref:GNAT family N-acetyltransferase n=1 Tax=Deinococcus betulae TaxID=2873312 RepID=UPI001CCAF403|nr:GNAT family N-acetyltransferase [Deinococcus betulae]MBZ9751138.1 GNAT family N-acetyltransferase [Deinococcus betulae]